MTVKTYTQRDLNSLIEEIRTTATIRARFIRPLAGGQPAGEKGIQSFVQHHLGLDPESEEFAKAVERISKEEVGERETTPEGGEVETSEVYQVNVIRRSEYGPFVLEHLIKALLKQAASRLGIFTAKKGAKGDMAEMGTVEAFGDSLADPNRPWEIHLIKDGAAAKTEYAVISGSVNTPKGKKSIQHNTETCEEGAEITFRISWPPNKLKADDMAKVIGAATVIGLGSCLSLGYGRFEVVKMTVED
jgi:hypothetical protein